MSEIEKWAARQNAEHRVRQDLFFRDLHRRAAAREKYRKKHPILFWLFGELFF